MITERKLQQLIEPAITFEKSTKISSDGRTFLTRIPKDIIDEMHLKKGQKVRWILDSKTKKIKIEIER